MKGSQGPVKGTEEAKCILKRAAASVKVDGTNCPIKTEPGRGKGVPLGREMKD